MKKITEGKEKDIKHNVIYVSEGGNRMKADKEIRILAQLLEVKTELQERALGRTGASKRMCLAEIKGIDRALEIVKKEIVEE